MPSVMDAPARVEHEEHAIQEAQSPVCTAPRGFWHSMVQYVRRPRVRTSSGISLRQLESPMARLAQEHPTLYLLGFCGIHSG
jgi:hypothetical protein